MDTDSVTDSDSEYVDNEHEKIGFKDTNKESHTIAETKRKSTPQNKTNTDKNVDKTSEKYSSATPDNKAWDDNEDFSMFIEDDSMSGISDAMKEYENEKSIKKLTIAEKIIRSQLPSSTYTDQERNTDGDIVNTTKSAPEKDKVTKISELEALLSQFNLPNHWIRVIPSFKVRENEADVRASSSKASFGRLVSLSTRLIETSLKTICPGPGYEEFKSYVFSKLIEKNQKSHQTPTKDPYVHQYVRTASEKVESVISCLCAWSNKSKKRSIERRVIRAILNESFLKHEIKDMKKKHNLKQGNGQPVAQARSDAIMLSQGNQLKLKTITRQCKLDSTIYKCVDFVLSKNNVSSVSWGVKSVLV